jgi:hypothetical protein
MDSMSRDLANVKSHNAAISETLNLHHQGISEALEKGLDGSPQELESPDAFNLKIHKIIE